MEINPFSLRAKAAMMYQLSGNVIGLFNGYVNPIAMAAIGWKYYIVWDIWLVCQTAIVYIFFPETHGLGLEEVAEVFGDALIDSEKTLTQMHALNTYKEKAESLHHVETIESTD
jgi:hypothetical protein